MSKTVLLNLHSESFMHILIFQTLYTYIRRSIENGQQLAYNLAAYKQNTFYFHVSDVWLQELYSEKNTIFSVVNHWYLVRSRDTMIYDIECTPFQMFQLEIYGLKSEKVRRIVHFRRENVC